MNFDDIFHIAEQEYAKELPIWWQEPNKCPDSARAYMVMRKFKELIIAEHGENAWLDLTSNKAVSLN